MAYGSRRRAISNTTYGRRVTRKVNRTARDVSGIFAIVSIVFELAGYIVDAIAWPFKKLFALVSPEPETPNEPIIDMDNMALVKYKLYTDKINEIRAKIDAADPTINWRTVTFHVSGITGSVSVTSSDKQEGAKIKAAY